MSNMSNNFTINYNHLSIDPQTSVTKFPFLITYPILSIFIFQNKKWFSNKNIPMEITIRIIFNHISH